MNENINAEQWTTMRGDVKSWWGMVTDSDLDRIAGRKDQMVQRLQEAYGYERHYAEQEVERRFKEFSEKSGGVVANLTSKAQELGANAASTANDAASAVGDKMESLAVTIRANAPSEGRVGTVASTIAGGLMSASSYLRDKKYNNLAKDVTGLVRTYPIHSLLIGVGVGYLLARRTR
ncbi:MAG: hypothetical protein R6V57_06870 [Vicinamibacterales bacterium]